MAHIHTTTEDLSEPFDAFAFADKIGDGGDIIDWLAAAAASVAVDEGRPGRHRAQLLATRLRSELGQCAADEAKIGPDGNGRPIVDPHPDCTHCQQELDHDHDEHIASIALTAAMRRSLETATRKARP